MSRESEVAAILNADATLLAILTGGVFVAGVLGPEGITCETAPAAFSSGFLLPCALVKQRARVTTGEIVIYDARVESARQMVEIWLFQDRGYTAIDAAAARIRTLLFGVQLSGSYELRPAQLLDRLRDPGALNLASMARYDWQIDSVVQ